MKRLVFDIETLGFPIDTFDEAQQDYLLRFTKTEEEKQDVLQKLSLYPVTAQVLAIGMRNPDTERGKVLFQSEEKVDEYNEDQSVKLISGTEKEILIAFWEDIVKYDQLITFNGRGFDCPFLLLRSAILDVKATRNLMPYRYDYREHCDLLEQLSFYNAFRKFNLDFYCKAFGIPSPKSEGITGLDIGRLVEEKRYRDIAEYCYRDVVATEKLFKIWEKNLKF